MFKEMMMRKEYIWLVLIVIVLIVGPLASIWALNTLFPVLAIPYTLETWAAMLPWLAVFSVAASASASKG
jgi:hypothetical protein